MVGAMALSVSPGPLAYLTRPAFVEAETEQSTVPYGISFILGWVGDGGLGIKQIESTFDLCTFWLMRHGGSSSLLQ